MLQLYRKAGEVILLNQGEIAIKVVTINPECVLIGIRAPRHIPIDRLEALTQQRTNHQYYIVKDAL